ncbi:MAG: TonB-dependent receptor [Rhodothermales bacterium]|jgi:TonB-dependent receptor
MTDWISRAAQAILTVVLGLLLAAPASGQTEGPTKNQNPVSSGPSKKLDRGSIFGFVFDEQDGWSLIGVNVVLRGTLIGASTDLDGRFEIPELNAGLYTLEATYIGYTTLLIEDIEVVDGLSTRLDLTMRTQALELGEVVVEAKAQRNTEASLLRMRSKSAAVSDAISSEAISRSGSGDAAAAMTKVTGASVVGGKYVYIRGLGDRYSSTTLNGSSLPSADPDKKAFQLDLFPSSLLDNIVTTKTFTPDKPGSFGGGLVDVGTKDFPEELTMQYSVSSTVNSQTTHADMIAYEGSSTDWLGRDSGTREIPDIVADPSVQLPTEFEARRDPEKAAQLDAVSRAFNGLMTPGIRTAPVNRSISAAVGNQIKLFGKPFGFTMSGTYGNSYSAYSGGTVGRWELIGGQVSGINELTSTRYFGQTEDSPVSTPGYDRKGSQEVNWGVLGTFAYKPHPRHSASVTFMRTQSGISESRELEGYWVDLSGNSTFQTRVLSYKQRALTSVQGRGEHAFGFGTLNWRAATSDNSQDEPDLRYFSNHYTARDRDDDGVFEDTLYQSPASLYPAPTRFYRDLTEKNVDLGADFAVRFRQWSGKQSVLKFGAAYTDVERDFRERRFEYKQGRGVRYGQFEGDNDAFFQTVGIVDTLSNGQPVFANYIQEASSDRSNYDGTQTVTAYYGMLELPLSRSLRLITGARLESTDMLTVSGDSTLPSGELNNKDWLPSANLVWAVTDEMNLRVAATRTLARPTFRELAPYATFDFVGDLVFRGNASLKQTLITNYDFRWEWFTRPGEITAISLFYKDFVNPIERVIQTSVGNNSLGIQNVPSGSVIGLELEIRQRLGRLSSRLQNFQIGGNLSIVDSSVKIPEEELAVIKAADVDASDSRPLEGQSPYLVNLDVGYDNPATGLSFSVFYNVFGSRLIAVSEGAAPDIFERSRATLDLTVSKRLISGVKINVNVKNLTNAAYLTSQQFKDTDYVYGRYQLGRSYSIGVSYSL